MHLRHAIGSDVVTVDGERVFRIRPDTELEGSITSGGFEVAYRVYGPFGPGYRIGLYNATEEIETL